MRILLDNCVPADLAHHIPGHEIVTAIDMGWDGLSDGALLDAIGGKFDVLLTVDKSMPFQQLISGRSFAVIVLSARTNRVGDLARLVTKLQKLLTSISSGEVREIGS